MVKNLRKYTKVARYLTIHHAEIKTVLAGAAVAERGMIVQPPRHCHMQLRHRWTSAPPFTAEQSVYKDIFGVRNENIVYLVLATEIAGD